MPMLDKEEHRGLGYKWSRVGVMSLEASIEALGINGQGSIRCLVIEALGVNGQGSMHSSRPWV